MQDRFPKKQQKKTATEKKVEKVAKKNRSGTFIFKMSGYYKKTRSPGFPGR